jgi:hypothetical protein
MKATREVFGESFVPELEEILTSTSTATAYGPDGKQLSTTEQPFTHPWQLLSVGFVEGSKRSRVTCVLEADGKVVTATIDAADFRRVSRNNSRTRTWNESDYHDMAALASTLIQEQILTWDPDKLPNEVHIRLPVDR